MDNFNEAFAGEKFLYPKEELIACRNFSYNRTDTHWTDFGATVAARALLDFWDLPLASSLPKSFVVQSVIGDLGWKLSSKQSDMTLEFSEDIDRHICFDNRVNNNGCIRVYANAEAPTKSTCVVFGDSFGTNLSKALAMVFARVLYIYKPASFDQWIVDIERPSHVVFEINQRFIVGQPDHRRSIFDIGAEKLRALPADAVSALRAYLEGFESGRDQTLARHMLQAIAASESR
jgi:hypothetical protein